MGGGAVLAAERLEVHFEDMSIPISIKELTDWSREDGKTSSELASWLNLLGFESRSGLSKLLQAPLVTDKSMARQLLRSWVGRKLLDEISDLIRLDEDRTGARVFNTLEILLDRQPQVTTLDLLKALPAESIHLDLDAWVQVANRWRVELKKQQKLVANLSSLEPKQSNIGKPQSIFEKFQHPTSKFVSIPVLHRSTSLRVQVWEPSSWTESRSSWIVFLPGLGGDQSHFSWLARNLSLYGWPVVVLEHPGSDSKAVQALLEGSLPAPGAEVLPDRLADLEAVLKAKGSGTLKVSGKKLVLMGHSLGALTAFLAAGASPQDGLAEACKNAFDDLSLTNLSELLQCQLVDVSLPGQKDIPPLNAIVAINSFGSLLWPRTGNAQIKVPVLITGGTFDLITPAISEQLGLMLSTSSNSLSRTLLVEGASHFSPVRVEGQLGNKRGDDLFQLGEGLVGFQPLLVQDLLSSEIINFLGNIESGQPVGESANQIKKGLKYHLLGRESVQNILDSQ